MLIGQQDNLKNNVLDPPQNLGTHSLQLRNEIMPWLTASNLHEVPSSETPLATIKGETYDLR